MPVTLLAAVQTYAYAQSALRDLDVSKYLMSAAQTQFESSPLRYSWVLDRADIRQ